VRVTINGHGRDLPSDAMLFDGVRATVDDPNEAGLAVALDGAVVPRAAWSETPLREGAVIEIVRAAAGG